MARKNIYFGTTKLEFMQYFSFLKNLFISKVELESEGGRGEEDKGEVEEGEEEVSHRLAHFQDGAMAQAGPE